MIALYTRTVLGNPSDIIQQRYHNIFIPIRILRLAVPRRKKEN